jgi:type I restriction enzyme R subunit
VTFELFDPKGELRVTRGALPHWYQPGATYFVTFRTEDSVPAELVRSWHRRRDEWLMQHGVEARGAGWRTTLRNQPELEREYNQTFAREFMAYLDRGHGECVLRRPELAAILAKSLRYADGGEYHLGDFVIMPNHVHLLVGLVGETDVLRLCTSWKHFTGHEINKALARRGRFWQEDSFDHLVRTPEAFDYLCRYIAENPVKARLKLGEYLLSTRVEK